MTTTRLQQIVALESYRSTLEQLHTVDAKHATQIQTALVATTHETHEGIQGAEGNGDRLKYYLYREAIEIKAHTSSYLSYVEMMASREANLWRFAFTVTEQFFDLVFDALDDYFDTKKALMLNECETASGWYSTIADSSKKLLAPANLAKSLLEKAAHRIGADVELPEGEVFDTKGIVEGILSQHLDPSTVADGVEKILDQATQRVRQTWEKEVKLQAPDLSTLKAFASHSGNDGGTTVSFELGIAEQTFAVGVTGAVVGAVGLAAGWHTITYAMLHVFPPVAIFSVLAAIGVAVFTKDRALDGRRKQVADAVNQYHRHLLLQIDTQKMEELGGKTMRQAMSDRSQQIVSETLRSWENAISGDLRAEHYQLLIGATTAHLMLVEEALQELDE
jgi:hypothetical protein